MKNYSIEIIDRVAKRASPVIIEFKRRETEVGYLVYDAYNTLTLLPLTASFDRPRVHFCRSSIRRIINLITGYVIPKEDHPSGRTKMLNIIEMNELINQAGYEYI